MRNRPLAAGGQAGEASAVVAPGMLENASVRTWLGGVEPVWALLDQATFSALDHPPSPAAGPIRLAADLAQEAAEKLKQTQDVQKVAEEFAARANMSPTEMVRETGFIKPGDDVANIGNSPQFEEGIAPLESVGQIGERTQIKDGFAVPALVEKREPRDAELGEVRDQVLAAYKIENAKSQMVGVAKSIAENANSADALKAAIEKAGLKASEAKDFKLGSSLGEGTATAASSVIDDQIYNLKVGEVTKTPISAGDNYYIVGLVNRKDASMDEFAKQRDDLVNGAASSKRTQVFTDYLADLRRRFEEQGRIKIYKDALAKLEENAKVTEIES
jgi:peptidyl-prolyl cis-trans isomerase D